MDPDGYTLKVDTNALELVAINATLEHAQVNPGNHVVEVGGVAANCALSGDNPRTVTITSGETTTASFVVTCVSPVARIAFISSRDGGSGIFLMNPDGTGVTKLTNGPSDLGPVWSADRRKLVFWDGGPGMDIHVIDGDGSGAANLTNTVPDHTNDRAINQEAAPAWSPDGTRIAFEADHAPPSEAANWDIYAVNVDGTGVTNLTNRPGSDILPAWSPDGSKIAYIGTHDIGPRLWVMNADGSGQAPISSDAFVTPNQPSWSPNGRMIVFTVLVNFEYELRLINVDGTGERTVTTYPGPGLIGEPTWSPDGSRIAYREGNHLVVINPDGTGRKQLTNGFVTDDHPTWSPEASRIAFTRTSGDFNDEIYVIDLASGAETNLTQSPASDTQPAWAP